MQANEQQRDASADATTETKADAQRDVDTTTERRADAQPDVGATTGARKADVLVDGMTCGSCVRRVQRALAAVDGVVVESIDRRGARIAWDDGRASRADILGAIADVGYTARIEVRS